MRGSGARVPSADRDATEPRAHSPRLSPGRGFVSALATPTSFSAKPTNPCRVPTEACWPRPREAPPAARPEARGKGGSGAQTGRQRQAHAQIVGAVPEGAGPPREETAGGGVTPERASRRSQDTGRRRLRRTIIIKHWDGAQGCVPQLLVTPELLKRLEPCALGTVSQPQGAGRRGARAAPPHTPDSGSPEGPTAPQDEDSRVCLA